MMNFYEAPAIVRSILTVGFFLLAVYVLAVVEYGIYTKVKKRHLVMIIMLAMISWFIFYCMRLAMMWACETSSRFEFEKWILAPVPIAIWFLLLIGLLVLYIKGYVLIKRWRNRSISSITLKAAMDNLPAGLCFYTDQGQSLMMNYKFQQLCKEITGEFVVNMLELRKTLENKCVNVAGHGLIWHSEDEHVWSFEFKALKEGVNQIIGSDVTEIWQLNENVKSQNAHIQKLNERLRDYNRNVEQVVKEDELLAARIRLHDDLGRILLMTRRYLKTDCSKEEFHDLYQQWHNMLAMLRNEGTLRVENDPATELVKAAESLGLKVIMKGDLPKRGNELKLLMSGARECMTNAAHYHANTIEIEISKEDSLTCITYRNNGDEPEYPVYLGGGLSSLKRIVEKSGALFEIAEKTPFFIKIIIPVGEEME